MGRSGCAPHTHPSEISKRIPMTDSTELEPTISTVFAPEPSMPTYQEEQQRIRANYERSGTSPSSPRRQNQRYARFRWTRTSAARSGCRSSIRPVASGSSIRERSRDARSCCRMQIAPAQGRPADEIPCGLRQTGRALRRPRCVLCLGHPAVQHHDLHGSANPQCAAVLCSVRTGGERSRLINERIQHVNRIKGLLAIHGIYDYEPMHPERIQRLEP